MVLARQRLRSPSVLEQRRYLDNRNFFLRLDKNKPWCLKKNYKNFNHLEQ